MERVKTAEEFLKKLPKLKKGEGLVWDESDKSNDINLKYCAGGHYAKNVAEIADGLIVCPKCEDKFSDTEN